MKKSRFNKSLIIIPVLSVLVILGFLFLTTNTAFWFKKSIHEEAKAYSTKHCLVFYPDCKKGKELAKSMAKELKDDLVHDYSLVPYGDYYLVDYGNGYSYFVDKEYNDIVINEISDDGKKIIADYLRYWVKRKLPDTYFSADFLEKSYIDNLSFDGISYEIEGESLKCRFPDYDVDVLVPLRYIQEEINMNFGYPNELYVKPTYIDQSHPVICLTFDDGPQFRCDYEESSSVSIVNTLYKYDATATFYVIGDRLEEREYWTDYEVYSFLKQSINNGNDYGSHTQTHKYYMTEFSSASALKQAVLGPGEFFESNLDYEIKSYRPPYGVFDDDTLSNQPLPAILWCIDSNDWQLDDAQEIYDKVFSYQIEDGDVLLFHEIYDTSAEAIEKIVPELINRGYQLVTIGEMLKYENIDMSTLKFYYNLNPSPYYE